MWRLVLAGGISHHAHNIRRAPVDALRIVVILWGGVLR
jgi:hypothetical protein